MQIRLQNISVSYIPPSVSNIWNNELVFETGKFYHIKANSGKGKSSFIHTLYGIQKNFSGQLQFDKADSHAFSHSQWCDLRSKKLSIVFQDLKLFEDKTALQNLQIKNELTNHVTQETIILYAEQLRVSHTLHRITGTLSYGERQRIAIIRALLQPFSCLLLDEPFSHLDSENISLASSLILQVVKNNNATLILCDLENDKHFPYHQLLNL